MYRALHRVFDYDLISGFKILNGNFTLMEILHSTLFVFDENPIIPLLIPKRLYRVCHKLIADY